MLVAVADLMKNVRSLRLLRHASLLAATLFAIGCDSAGPLEVGGLVANGQPATQTTSGEAGSSGSGQAGSSGSGQGGRGGVLTIAPSQGTTCAALADAAQPTTAADVAPPPAGCVCTRRPGPYNSYMCPMGIGESTTKTIGPEGGEIALQGQQYKESGVPFQIIFPPGALTTATTVRVTETSIAPPDGFMDDSPVYLIEPRGLELARIARLQVPFSVASGMYFPKDLAVLQRAETGDCGFTRIADSYTNAGFEMSSLTSFGYLFVGTVKTAAQQSCP